MNMRSLIVKSGHDDDDGKCGRILMSDLKSSNATIASLT